MTNDQSHTAQHALRGGSQRGTEDVKANDENSSTLVGYWALVIASFIGH